MGWKDVKKHGQKSDFLALKDGEKVKLRVLSAEPLTNYQIYSEDLQEGANVTEDYPLPDPLKARVQHIFVVFNLGTKQVQILKTSTTTAEKFLANYEAYNDSFDHDILFSRKGAGFNDTEYSAVVIPTEFTPDMLGDTPLPDLEKIFAISEDAQIARVIPGALKKAKIEHEKKQEEKAAKKAAKDKKAGIATPPAAAKPAPAPAPTPAPAAAEASLDSLEETPKAEAPKFSPVRVIHDLRTEEDKNCPKCKKARTIKEGNIKAIDVEHKLPWGRVKVAVCTPCNGMTVIEKLTDPTPVAA